MNQKAKRCACSVMVLILVVCCSVSSFAANNPVMLKREVQSRDFEGTNLNSLQKDFQDSLLDLGFSVETYNKDTKVGLARKPGFIVNWIFQQNKKSITGRVTIYKVAILRVNGSKEELVIKRYQDVVAENKDGLWDVGFSGWGSSECIYTRESMIACDLYVPASTEDYANFWKHMGNVQFWKLVNVLPEEVR